MPGVVLLSNGPITRADRRRGAVLYAGDDAVITGLDALDLLGMTRMPAPHGPVHVLVPTDRRRAGAGQVLVERTDRLPVPSPGRWPLAPLARAGLDATRRMSDRNAVRATLAEIVQRGRCTVAELAAELAAGSGRGSAVPRAVLAEVGDGIRSVAEAEARTLLLSSTLPRPMWNPRLVDARTGRFIAVPDAWFDDVGLAWEIESYEWHLGPEEYEYTIQRRVAMTAEGIAVVPHSPNRIRTNGPDVLDDLARNLAHAALRPRPAVRAIPA